MEMFSNHESFPRLNCLCDGEVINVTKGSGEAGKGPILYDVSVTMPTGAQVMLVNVPVASMFGGIGDSFQIRLRGTFDDSSNAPSDEQFFSDGGRGASLGARVLVAFVGGHLSRPLIVGYPPHPTTNWHYDKHADKKPQAIWTYLGVTMSWDETGQFEIVRRGAPEEKYVPKEDGLLGAAAGALSALGALNGGADPTLPPEIDNLGPADEIETMRLAFRDGGIFRVNDYNGQMIEMDATKERIYISNNDIKSTDGPDATGGLAIATNSTDAEYILWDRQNQRIIINTRSMLHLYSFDRRKDTTDGDYLSNVKGACEWQIFGDLTETIGGSHTYTLNGDFSGNATGSWQMIAGADFQAVALGGLTMTAAKDMALNPVGKFNVGSGDDAVISASGISTLTLSKGKVALKGAAGEVVDLLGQVVDAIMQLTVPTAVGPSGPPINSAAFVKLKATLALLKA